MSKQNGSYGEWILKYRFLVLCLISAVTLLCAAGAQYLYFDNDYRVFFGKENPQLKAFEQIQQFPVWNWKEKSSECTYMFPQCNKTKDIPKS